MKRHHSFLLALLAAVLLAAPARAYGDAAFASLPFTDAAGVTTVVTDTQGGVHSFDGALDAAALAEHPAEAAKIASYALAYDGETLLAVTQGGFEEPEETFSLLGAGFESTANGFYSVEFDYTEDGQDYTVYMTGLKLVQAEEVQDALLEALQSKLAALGVSEFGKLDRITLEAPELSFIDYIDAEKLATWENTPANAKVYCGDSELCWAATTSNLLYYTGWAQHAEVFQNKDDLTEDDVMDLFWRNFNDGPGHIRFGLEWFFNKRFEPDKPTAEYDDWAKRKDNSADGGYYPDCSPLYYCEQLPLYTHIAADAAEETVTADPQRIETAFERLRDGYGVGVSMAWYKNGNVRDGGHAITLWGYVQKKGAASFDKGNYAALLIGDSDSDAVNDLPSFPSDYVANKDRREAANKLCVMPLYAADPFVTGSGADARTIDSWRIQATGTRVGVVEEFVTLRPYEADYFRDDGTFDNTQSPDLDMSRSKVYILEDPSELMLGTLDGDDPLAERTAFPAGRELWVNLWSVWNRSDARYSADSVGYTVELRRLDDKAYKTAASGVFPLNGGMNAGDIPYARAESVSLGSLEAGTYALRVFAEKTDGVVEAYYLNNYTGETVFTVTDEGYDLGDAALEQYAAIAATDEEYVYELPMIVTGLTGEAERCYAVVSGLYDTEDGSGKEWHTSYRTASGSPDEPLSILVGHVGEVVVRVLVKPIDDPEGEPKPWAVLEKKLVLSGRAWFVAVDGDDKEIPVRSDGDGYYIEKDGKQLRIEQSWRDGYYATDGENRYPLDYGSYSGCDFDLFTRSVGPWALYQSENVVVAGYDRLGRMVFCASADDLNENWEYVYEGDVVKLKVFLLDRETFAPRYEALTVN